MPKTKLGRKPSHPWDTWFTLQNFSLKPLDYTCTIGGMIQQIRDEACKRGLSIKVTGRKGTIKVEVLSNAKAD